MLNERTRRHARSILPRHAPCRFAQHIAPHGARYAPCHVCYEYYDARLARARHAAAAAADITPPQIRHYSYVDAAITLLRCRRHFRRAAIIADDAA